MNVKLHTYIYVYVYIGIHISKCFMCRFFLADKRGTYNLLKKCNSHVKVYLKEEIPDRFYYHCNKRIQPITLVADEGCVCVYIYMYM